MDLTQWFHTEGQNAQGLYVLDGQWHMYMLCFRKPSVEFVFFVTVEMYECCLRSFEMVRPRYGLLLTHSRMTLLRS